MRSLYRVFYFVLIGSFAYGANMATSPLSSVRVFPNPWRVDKDASSAINFTGMPPGSQVKIFTVSAHEVATLTADGNGNAPWLRTNSEGQRVASGVYIYLVIDPQGNETSGKLAVIQ